MKKLLRIALILTAVLISLYFITAVTLTFLPEPTFPVAPFPVAGRATADFTPQHFTTRDGETLFARQFPAESDTTILLLHGVTSDSAAFNLSAERLREASGAEVIDHAQKLIR